jgi:glycosyltransferase involved in cell wall biosynthesis
VLLEALSYQLPVVSTDTEGPNDFLRDGENALVVPKGDASALAQGLRRLLRDHALADRLAVAGMYMVRERFVVGPFSRNLSTALEELLCQTSSFSRAA